MPGFWVCPGSRACKPRQRSVSARALPGQRLRLSGQSSGCPGNGRGPTIAFAGRCRSGITNRANGSGAITGPGSDHPHQPLPGLPGGATPYPGLPPFPERNGAPNVHAVTNRPSPPRLGLTVEEAAKAVGMSESSFKRHVQPELRIVRRGSLRIIPVPEIEKWLEDNATLAASAKVASRMVEMTKRPRAVGAAGGMAQGDATP